MGYVPSGSVVRVELPELAERSIVPTLSDACVSGCVRVPDNVIVQLAQTLALGTPVVIQ